MKYTIPLLLTILMPTASYSAEPDDTSVLVIAHRGASGYLPEHTLEAKMLAYGMGADYLEQDLVLTRDDIPIVLHDIHLDTVTDVRAKFADRHREDGRFYAIDFTLAEIKQLAVFERFDHRTAKAIYPNRFPGHLGNFRIPTFEEELELISGLNRSTQKTVGIYPELKAPGFHHEHGKDLATIVLSILGKVEYEPLKKRVFMQCFDQKETRRLKEELACPYKIVQLLGDEPWLKPTAPVAELQQHLQQIAQYADGIGPSINTLFYKSESNTITATETIQQAHNFHLFVHAYTYRTDAVATPFSSFEELHLTSVKSGINGMFTDFPDVTRHLLNNLEENR